MATELGRVTEKLERVPVLHRKRPALVLPDDSVVGDYTLTYLAQGGSSLIYRGVKQGHDFIVKEVPSEQPSKVLALVKEKELLELLSHPAIPDFVELFEESSHYYLVREFLPGETLDRALEEGQLSEETVRDWGGQLCRVLEHLHETNPPIIYGSLLPEAVLVHEGRVWLLDLDPATRQARELQADSPLASPEYHAGREIDSRSDVFTVAALLYKLLTGPESPADGGLFPPLREQRKQLTHEMEGILTKALHPSPDERFQNLEQLRVCLAQGHKAPEEEVGGLSDLARLPRWKRILLLAVAISVVILLAIGFSQDPKSQSEAPRPAATSPTPVKTTQSQAK